MLQAQNKGIHDALIAGVPLDYVNRVIRPFIPEESPSEAKVKARKQASNFEDEN